MGSTFPRLQDHLDDILAQGPPRVYFPEPNKSILVISAHNIIQAERFFCGKVLTVVTGVRYLGSYIENAGPQAEWLSEMVRDWEGGVITMEEVAHKYLQGAYAGLHKSLQQEWYFE